MTLAAFFFASSLIYSSSLPSSSKVEIKKIESIGFENDSDMQFIPRSFCVVKDKKKEITKEKIFTFFFILDHVDGVVKVFKKSSNLRFLKQFGPNGAANTRFGNPAACFYNADHKIFGIIDISGKQTLYLFKRTKGTILDSVVKIPDVNGSDIDISGDGKHAVIAGYYEEKGGNIKSKKRTFEMYSINLKGRAQSKNPLLDSFQKYGLTDADVYYKEYFLNRTLPAIGIRSFIDVWGDYVYHIWEGKSRIIKININTGKQVAFNHITPQYIEPFASKELLKARRQREFNKTRKEKEKMSYVRDIYATQKYVFLIYRGPRSKTNCHRMQVYTSEIAFIDDISLPLSFSAKTWLDKNTLQLYSLSKTEATGKYCISVYRINVKNVKKDKNNRKKEALSVKQ